MRSRGILAARCLSIVLAAGCGSGDGAGAIVSEDSGTSDDRGHPRVLPDPGSEDDWRLDRAAGGVLDVMTVDPEGRLLVAGRLGLLAERGSDGAWQEIDLGPLLTEYMYPHGWQQLLHDGEDLWMAGALGFYHGGAMRRHAGAWTIAYDEVRDTPPFVRGGPLSDIALAQDGSVVLPLGGQLVHRDGLGAFRLVDPEDDSVAFSGVAAAGGRIIGVGERVYELEDAATGRWRTHTAMLPAGIYVQRAALDGERLYGVGYTREGEALAISGTVDALVVSSQPSRLWGVAVFAPGDVWAVGEEGLVLRHGEAGWRRIPGPRGSLVAISVAQDAVYVGTADAAVYRYAP